MGPSYNENIVLSRNKQIVIDYAFGKTYAELGAQHGVTHQRISQILHTAAMQWRTHPTLFRTPRMQQVLLDSMKPRMHVHIAETPEEFFWELMNERKPDEPRR